MEAIDVLTLLEQEIEFTLDGDKTAAKKPITYAELLFMIRSAIHTAKQLN